MTSYERPAAGRSALCGADGGLILSRRRSPEPVDYGFVGDPLPDRFGLDAARMLIDAGYTPVVAPITADAEGEGLLNTNADTVAQTVAVGMSARLRDGTGLLLREAGRAARRERRRRVIAEITPDRFAELRPGASWPTACYPSWRTPFGRSTAGVRSVGDLLGRPDRVAGLRGNDAAEVSSRVA